MTPAEYVAIWTTWDERPGDDHRATAMESATAEIAEAWGVTSTDLRTVLAALRRMGLTREAAFRTIRFGIAHRAPLVGHR